MGSTETGEAILALVRVVRIGVALLLAAVGGLFGVYGMSNVEEVSHFLSSVSDLLIAHSYHFEN